MKIMSNFKLNKNRRYNYTPRYYKGKEEGNIYEFGSKFEKYRDTLNSSDYGSHWKEARQASRNRGNRGLSRTLIITIAVLTFIALYILDFDLSIFFS